MTITYLTIYRFLKVQRSDGSGPDFNRLGDKGLHIPRIAGSTHSPVISRLNYASPWTPAPTPNITPKGKSAMELWDKTKKLARENPVLTGALGGAAAGSVVPGIGTLAGAVTGAVVGFLHKGTQSPAPTADKSEKDGE